MGKPSEFAPRRQSTRVASGHEEDAKPTACKYKMGFEKQDGGLERSYW
jgi:hypothetical protein